MGNCALKPKVLTETGAPAPENLNESLLDDQKLDTTKPLGHFLQQDEAEQKSNGDEKIVLEAVKEKAAEPGDRTAYVDTQKQELSTETKPPTTTTDDKNYENKETIDDELENIEDKKVVEEVAMKEIEKREKNREERE